MASVNQHGSWAVQCIWRQGGSTDRPATKAMKTPWGTLPIADAHVHLLSRAFFEDLSTERTPEEMGRQLGWEIPSKDAAELAGRWMQEMEKYDLKRLVLIGSFPGDENSVAGAVRTCPEKFVGYFMLNPTAEDALQRAKHAIENVGLRGICLFPAMHKFSVSDDRLHPIYELASGRAIVFVHMGVLSVGVRKKLGLPSLFDIRLSNPIALHPIALEFPRVNFVIPHFGAGYFREALMLGDLCPNVYLDTSSTNSWIRYVPGLNGLTDVFRRTLDVFSVQRILFGTDSSFFPRGWNAQIFTEQVEALDRLGISAADAAAIFGGNLERLIGSLST
jgi:predicted TIM-barrel fold metal-dependent hydrolase